MKYNLSTQNGKVVLTPIQLIITLASKINEKQKKDLEVLSQVLSKYLEDNNLIQKSTISTLISIGFYCGYYYHVFLKNNSVEIEYAPDSLNSNEPTSTGNGT